jgi:hypothetical protein
MAPKLQLGDPEDLFFGLNDLAARVRTLGPEEQREWTSIASYINDYIDCLSSMVSSKGRLRKPLTGGMEQGITIALHALEMARHSAEKRAIDSTAEAVEHASRAVRGASAGGSSRLGFATGS